MRLKTLFGALVLSSLSAMNGCSSVPQQDIVDYDNISKSCLLRYKGDKEVSPDLAGFEDVPFPDFDVNATYDCKVLESVIQSDGKCTSLCRTVTTDEFGDYTDLCKISYIYDKSTKAITNVEVVAYGSIN